MEDRKELVEDLIQFMYNEHSTMNFTSIMFSSGFSKGIKEIIEFSEQIDLDESTKRLLKSMLSLGRKKLGIEFMHEEEENVMDNQVDRNEFIKDLIEFMEKRFSDLNLGDCSSAYKYGYRQAINRVEEYRDKLELKDLEVLHDSISLRMNELRTRMWHKLPDKEDFDASYQIEPDEKVYLDEAVKSITSNQRKAIFGIGREIGLNDSESIKSFLEIESISMLSEHEADEHIRTLLSVKDRADSAKEKKNEEEI